jgi:lipid II:glycine glycyltransferase (peptidoglycan interpeptide bridge formation enzyme)
MEIFFTQDKQWLDKWDDFVGSENTGSHLLLSDWVKSFSSYGFESDYCLCVVDGAIVGGFAAVVAKMFGFSFYIVPFGPIINKANIAHLNTLVSKVPERARVYNSCYCHITLPVSAHKTSHTISRPSLAVLHKALKGHLFKYVYSSNGLNWISLDGFDEETKINTLKPSVRRNVRNSYRKDLVFSVLETRDEIEAAYRLFGENASQAGYSLRSWNDIKECLFALQDKGLLKVLAAYRDDVLKGAILLVRAGNYYTYILGGSKKEVPDLRTGDFLQWEAIKRSLAEKLDGYNISLGGSPGVVDFKNSFNTEQLIFEGQYHWVLRPTRFRLFMFVEGMLKPHKKIISKILSSIKKKK